MKFVVVLISVILALQCQAETSSFIEAQQAASEGRYEDVTRLLTEAISAGGLIQDQLAIAYSNRGIAHSLLKEYDAAIADLQKAHELDPQHLLTLNHLGILAEHIEKSPVEAAKWYALAAEMDYPAGQVNLANLLQRGYGVQRDALRAKELYRAAADQGYPPAMVALGEMLLKGGQKTDVGKAIELLERAAEQGQVTAHHHLGFAHERGQGVAVDFAKAKAHYLIAALEGYGPSQGALGYLYRMGRGTDRDFTEAVKWYRLAAEQGDFVASNRLAWLMATCPVEEVCDAETALEFARQAVNADDSATNLDSLAAAHARKGEFDEAQVLMKKLLATKALSASARAKYERRLERYRLGIPFQI